MAENGNGRRNAHFLSRASCFCLALLFLLVFAIYWPAVRGQFVWDDQLLIAKNPLVTGKANLGTIWFETDFSLTTISLWLQWLLWETIRPVIMRLIFFFTRQIACCSGACCCE